MEAPNYFIVDDDAEPKISFTETYGEITPYEGIIDLDRDVIDVSGAPEKNIEASDYFNYDDADIFIYTTDPNAKDLYKDESEYFKKLTENIPEKKLMTKEDVIKAIKSIPQNLKDYALEQYNVIRNKYGSAKYTLTENAKASLEKLKFSFSSLNLKDEFNNLKEDIKTDMKVTYTDIQKAFYVFKYKMNELNVLIRRTSAAVFSTRASAEFKKNALKELLKTTFDTFNYYFDATTLFILFLLVLLSLFTGFSVVIAPYMFYADSSGELN